MNIHTPGPEPQKNEWPGYINRVSSRNSPGGGGGGGGGLTENLPDHAVSN